MIVYDDLEPSEKIKVYDKGISFTDDPEADPRDARRLPHRRHVGAAARRDRGAARRGADTSSTASSTARRRRPTDELGPAGRRADRGRDELDARQGETVDLHASMEEIMIPFVDLKAQYASIKDEVDAAIQGVLDSCQFMLGSEVAAFERSSPRTARPSHGIGVNSGTSALHLALLAAGVGPGDEVITVPFTFVRDGGGDRLHRSATRSSWTSIRARSRWTSRTIEAAITPRTKAIVPVHLYGQPADMDPILEIARRHGLVVIEDAGQAHGAEYKGRRAGSLGDMGCFSFYPGKNLGAYGEGGASSTTDDADYARTIRMLRDWGAEQKYHHVLKGFNYRMEGIQGAVLRVKLRHLEAWTEARRAAAAPLRPTLLAGTACPTPRQIAVRAARLSRLRDPHARSAPDLAGCARRARDPDGHPLSDSGAPAACVRRSRLPRRTVSAFGAGRERSAVAADVRRADRSAKHRSQSRDHRIGRQPRGDEKRGWRLLASSSGVARRSSTDFVCWIAEAVERHGAWRDRQWGALCMSRNAKGPSRRPRSMPRHPRPGKRQGRQCRRRPREFGGDEEDRTPDLRIANATLSQLSYVPTRDGIIAAGPPARKLPGTRRTEVEIGQVDAI